MLKRKHAYAAPGDVVFRPALTPLEAAVLPARQRRGRAALHLLSSVQTERFAAVCRGGVRDQRQKIWVR